MKAWWLSLSLWLGAFGCADNHDVAGYLQGATTTSAASSSFGSNGGSNSADGDTSDDDVGGDTSAGGAVVGGYAGAEGAGSASEPAGGDSTTSDDADDDSADSNSADSDVADTAGNTDGSGFEPAPDVSAEPTVPVEAPTVFVPEVPSGVPSTSSTVPFEEAFPEDPGSESWPPGGFPEGPPPGEPALWVSGWSLDPPPLEGVLWPLPFSLDQFFGEPELEPGYQRGMWVRGYDGAILASWWYDVTHDPTLPLGVLTEIAGQRFVVTVDLSGNAYMVSADLPPEGTQPLLPIPDGL